MSLSIKNMGADLQKQGVVGPPFAINDEGPQAESTAPAELRARSLAAL